MNISELLKGIIIGIAKIIPGLSGAVLMISFNLYDRAIYAITHFFENSKKNALFLLNLGLGIVIGIVLFSRILSFFITNYYLYTTSLFIGLILGGIPIVRSRIKRGKVNYFLIIISFFIMSFLAVINTSNCYVIKNNICDLMVFFLSGILEAIGTILPGISSTALLMLVGIYPHFIATLGNILNPFYLMDNLYFMIPFSLGMILGIILLSLLVNYLFKYYKERTFAVILGISFSSILLLIVRIYPYIFSIKDLVVSGILLVIGYFITRKID